MTDCKEELRATVNRIADEIAGRIELDIADYPECADDDREPSGFDYIADALDIEYIVASDRKTLLGARILVAFGGPNIWINTRTRIIEGAWWTDSYSASYDADRIGVEEAIETLFAC